MDNNDVIKIGKDSMFSQSKWLKLGYVLKKNAKGVRVYYQKIREYIYLYPRSEVTRNKRLVQAELNRIRKLKNKKARVRRLRLKLYAELQKRQIPVITVSYLDEENLLDEREYDFIADNEETFEEVQIGDIFEVDSVRYIWDCDGFYDHSEYCRAKVVVVSKEYKALRFENKDSTSLRYDYRFLKSGKRFHFGTRDDMIKIEDEIEKLEKKLKLIF